MFMNKKAMPWYVRMVDRVEHLAKGPLFDCSDCGQCILRSTALTCPMRCPKQMRNGPCGGSMDGKCEVFPDRPCIWNLIWERSQRLGWRRKLEWTKPAVDWRLWGTPSWWNLLTGRIDINGNVRPPKGEQAAAGDGSAA